MVFLGDDDDLLCLEYFLGPVHAFISGETGVIHKDIVGGDAGIHGKLLHGVHLVVAFPAVVAGH